MIPDVSTNGSGPSRGDRVKRQLALGYITSVAVPPVGLILGIWIFVRLPKPDKRHGAWMIGISIVASVIWFLLLTSPVLTSSTNQLS